MGGRPMTCIIERTHKKNELHYRFREYAQWSVSANHYGLAGFRLGKLTLMDQQKPICVAAQRMTPRQFWGSIPFINMFAHPHWGTNFIPRDTYASRASWQPEEK